MYWEDCWSDRLWSSPLGVLWHDKHYPNESTGTRSWSWEVYAELYKVQFSGNTEFEALNDICGKDLTMCITYPIEYHFGRKRWRGRCTLVARDRQLTMGLYCPKRNSCKQCCQSLYPCYHRRQAKVENWLRHRNSSMLDDAAPGFCQAVLKLSTE